MHNIGLRTQHYSDFPTEQLTILATQRCLFLPKQSAFPNQDGRDCTHNSPNQVVPTPCADEVSLSKIRGSRVEVPAFSCVRWGGAYEVLSPGTPTGFNPLQLENSGPNRDFLLRLLKSMLRSLPVSISRICPISSKCCRVEKRPSKNVQRGMDICRSCWC